MAIFNSKEEALKSSVKSLIMDIDESNFRNHSEKYAFFKSCDKFNHRNMGKFFLYEKVKYNQDRTIQVFYTKLGIYLNELPCDQTTEFEWVDCRRNYEWNIEYKYTYNDKEFQLYLAELPTEVKRLLLWFDDLMVYGAWDSKPNWKQLRQAYERTWWFYRDEDEKRDIQLNRILG